MLTFTLFVILAFPLVLGSIVFYTIKYGISPMPSSKKAREAIFAGLPLNFQPKIILELGSGWGSLAFPLAQHFPNAKVIAYEISPFPFFFSKCWQKLFYKKNNLVIKREDFFKASFQEADLIFCYLSPKIMEKLGEKFLNELKSNSLIVSNTFAIKQMKPNKTIEINDLYKTKIYYFIVN